MKTKSYLGNYYGDKFHDGYDGAVYLPDTVSPTLRARNGGGCFVAYNLDTLRKVRENIKVTLYIAEED